jgi:hypothetical protein
MAINIPNRHPAETLKTADRPVSSQFWKNLAGYFPELTEFAEEKTLEEQRLPVQEQLFEEVRADEPVIVPAETITILEEETPVLPAEIIAENVAVNGLSMAVSSWRSIKKSARISYQKAREVYASKTADMVVRAFTAPEYKNHRRVGLVSLGAVALGAYMVSRGFSHTEVASQAQQTASVANHVQTAHTVTEAAGAAVVHAKAATELTDSGSQTFVIEHGHGFTQEITDYFRSKHQTIKPTESLQMFQAMREKFGDTGILQHAKGLSSRIYMDHGLPAIRDAGKAQWAPRVTAIMKHLPRIHK